jgi:hypothetical protein
MRKTEREHVAPQHGVPPRLLLPAWERTVPGLSFFDIAFTRQANLPRQQGTNTPRSLRLCHLLVHSP